MATLIGTPFEEWELIPSVRSKSKTSYQSSVVFAHIVTITTREVGFYGEDVCCVILHTSNTTMELIFVIILIPRIYLCH